MADINVFLDILVDALMKKENLLIGLLSITKEQKEIIDKTEFDNNKFDETLNKKDSIIKQIEEIDNGFQMIYERIQGTVNNQKHLYVDKIRLLQKKIKSISDVMFEIQALEQKNKIHMQLIFRDEKNKVTGIKKNRKVAANYYKNMSDSYNNGSYFMDKKK